jgi:aminoglycoside phosphotransferase (APT) family kinase protein
VIDYPVLRVLPEGKPLSKSNPELLSSADTVPVDWSRLADYLQEQGLAFDPAQPIRQFAGGFANRNYMIVVDGRTVVLRRPPDGDLPPGAHDMAREHRILSRLTDALSFVPRSFHLCESRDVIGVPFQLIEYRAGIVVRGTDLSPVASYPDAPARLCEMMVTTLASLHQVDARSVGLEDLGKPEGFITRAVAGWSKRGALVAEALQTRTVIGEISHWLGRQRFRARAATILHCDFKLDNLILNPSDLSPVALIDWDMGTRGDPLFDLATLLSYWAEPGDPPALHQLRQMPTAHAGFWSRAEVAQRYAALTGCDLGDLPAMRVLALLKLGVVFLQLHRQWINGAVKDHRYAEFGQLGDDLLIIAHDLSTGKSHG